MGEDSQASAPAHYRAFISYSHTDARFAGWLHRKMEAWSLPGQTRLSPVFIDRAELAAGPDLSAQVRAALAASAALIVVASPAARASRWVAQEISLYRELHPDRPVLAALIEGEPVAAFPGPLLSHGGMALEPLAADFREGHDGKRLALLKIVAGLTALPLDRLVQRDAQSRQRRVMAVTAGAVLLSLILAAALIAALRARTEAEHQRAEAEGMVEFMLTDLRDKLKGVGRLDVMDAVNERAMAHYVGENLASLPDDVLNRRARLLLALGEDDLATQGKRGKAKAEIGEAWRTTELLLSRWPNDPERMFDHAQSEYWMGYIGFLERSLKTSNGLAKAEVHWRNYRRLADALVASDPQSPRWRRELAYSEGNLCSLMLELPGRSADALPHCLAGREAIQIVAQSRPHDIEIQLDLANRLAWEADAISAQNRVAEAISIRRAQITVVTNVLKQAGTDARVREALLLAQFGLAKALLANREQNKAYALAAEARQSAAFLYRLDPANKSWNEWKLKLEREFPNN